MKLSKGKLVTTTELMKEIFGMSNRMIYNIPEITRYEKIYKYLMENGAKVIGKKDKNNNSYTIFHLSGDSYFIPETIFDENSEEWKLELEKDSSLKNDEIRSQLRIV